MTDREEFSSLSPEELKRIADLDFQTALAELETVVDHLESGELPLEQALEFFEKGVALSRHCEQKLKTAEARIEKLLDDGTVIDITEETLPSEDER